MAEPTIDMTVPTTYRLEGRCELAEGDRRITFRLPDTVPVGKVADVHYDITVRIKDVTPP